MNKTELKKLAIHYLNSKNVQKIRKNMCKQIIDKKEIKECLKSFDENFVRSFMSSYKMRNK